MANWNGTARSNYFRVKDEEAFLQALEPYEIGTWDGVSDPTKLAIYSNDGDTGDWACYDEDMNEIPIWEIVAPHLQDGQVAVFLSAGAEKMRYITGSAVAVTNKGEPVSIYLSEIYAKASRAFGVPMESITDASY